MPYERNLRIKHALVHARLTQRRLAYRVRLHESRLSAIINGRIVPSDREQVRIAKALGATVDELFSEPRAVA